MPHEVTDFLSTLGLSLLFLTLPWTVPLLFRILSKVAKGICALFNL